MYESISLDELLERATDFTMKNDRELYDSLMAAAENYVREHGCIIGGGNGLDMLLGRSKNMSSYELDIYSKRPWIDTKNIADLFHSIDLKHLDKRLIEVQTNIRDIELTIFVNTRAMVKVHALKNFGGTDLIRLMDPPEVRGIFTSASIKCMSQDLQLINIYRKLYSPHMKDKWPESIIAEDELFKKVEYKYLGKSGGKAAEFNQELKAKTTEKIIDFIAGGRDILIGDYAIDCTVSRPLKFIGGRRLQLIISRSIDEFYSALVDLNIGKLSYVSHPTNIPDDFRITKYTIYLEIAAAKYPLLDAYNSASYEMIPCGVFKWKGETINYGNPYVLLRFKFIDLWVLKIIAKNVEQPIKFTINDIVTIRNYIKSRPLEEMFSTFYLGVFTNENVAKKQLFKAQARLAPYYPAKPREE